MRSVRSLSLLFVWLAIAITAPRADAATITVCASGCQYADLQAAINAAVPGDTLMLRAGQTFTGNFNLPAKSGTAWITIRSDAADSQLPGSGVRLVPSGKTGANTSRTLLARLVGLGGALKSTAVVSAASGAHNYRLQFLEIDGTANIGYETLVQLGPATAVAPPTDIVFDRVYMHGHPIKGQKRGVALNGARLDILNSYISDIKAVNADSQGICAYNGTGPFKIVNNFIEAAAENILFGGAAPAFTNLVPADITLSRNTLTKPLAWRNPILAAPAAPAGSAVAGTGTLSAGAHYFKIVAVMYTGTTSAVSLPSAEVAVTTAAGGAAKLTWSAVSGAEAYRVYHGLASGGENQFVEVTTPSVSFTGAGLSSGTPPASGTLWTVKNILEIKNGERITVDGNILENIWAAGQFGYAIMLTPRNSDAKTPWARVKDVSFTNNIIRHATGVIDILGHDDTSTSGRTQNVMVRNNSFEDIDNVKYGGGARAVLIGLNPSGVTFDHNTFIHNNTSVLYAYGAEQMQAFTWTNNIAKHNQYGVMGEASSMGNPTIAKFFPGGVFTCNTLAGGNAALYPSPNAFPTVAQWTSSFVNYSAGDYRLATTTYVTAPGCSGTPGVDYAALANALGAPAPAPTPTPTPSPTPNAAPVARPGGPYSGVVGTAVTVNGSSSTDADGSLVSFRWGWAEDILVRAADIPAAQIHGNWARLAVTGAAGGVAMNNPDKAAAKQAPLAAPTSYVEFTIQAAAGVPYRLWVRMRAGGDSYANDSMSVQFSGSVDAAGVPGNRIGTTGALAVILEEGNGAGVSAWGWNDAGYGTIGAPIYFATSGPQTIRIQTREDGIMWDQFMLSSVQYRTVSPGLLKSDTTIVPTSFGVSTGMSASHAYTNRGTFPVGLVVTDNLGATGYAATTVVIK